MVFQITVLDYWQFGLEEASL